MSSVAHVLKFDKCLDSGDENPSWDSNGSIVLILEHKGLHGEYISHFLVWAEKTQLKHQHKIRPSASFKALNQETESQASAGVLNLSSISRSWLACALDLDSDKHLVVEKYCVEGFVVSDDKTLKVATKNEEHCMVGLVGSDDRTLNSATKDETMCGSFLQAILLKQYKDADISCSLGSNEENDLSCGQDQSTPSNTVTYLGLSSWSTSKDKIKAD